MAIDNSNLIRQGIGAVTAGKYSGNTNIRYTNYLTADKLELSAKSAEKKTAKTAKFLIGAGITAAAAGLAFLVYRKINAPKILPGHIDFKWAETLEEAKKFGKNILGIKKYKGFTEADLDVINWANQGLVHVNNAAKGCAVMPKQIVLGAVGGGDACMNGTGILTIDKDMVHTAKELFLKHFLAPKNVSTALKDPKFFTNLKFYIAQNSTGNASRYISPFSEISHEMGHWQHQNNIGSKLYNSMLNKGEEIYSKNIPRFLRRFLESRPKERLTEGIELRRLFDSKIDTAAKVSEYAKTTPLEFIAECYSKMADGIKLDADIMELYRKLGGAAI